MKFEKNAKGNYEIEIKDGMTELAPDELDALEAQIKKIRLMPALIKGLKDDGYDVNAIKADEPLMCDLMDEFIDAVGCAVDSELLDNYERMSELMGEFEDEFGNLLEPYEN